MTAKNNGVSHDGTSVLVGLEKNAFYEHDIRCAGCGRKLGRGRLMPGSRQEIRCPRCNKIHIEEVPFDGGGYKRLLYVTLAVYRYAADNHIEPGEAVAAMLGEMVKG